MVKKLVARLMHAKASMRIRVRLLTFGVLAAGLTSCGSSSALAHSGLKPSVSKQAGLTLDVQLTVINQSGVTLHFAMCGGTAGCSDTFALSDGQEATATGAGPHGHFEYADGSRIYFFANNPTIGQPVLHLDPNIIFDKTSTVIHAELAEGEVQNVAISAGAYGHLFQLERRGDTEYKVMRLIAQ